jgi:diguanylate cyclase (GGDEF)-like protein
MSTTDQLTGLHNRREIMRRVGEEQTRLHRSGQIYSVIIMDIDHFKKVNDTYGHNVGDQTLKGVAGTLNACKRSSDTLARYGGEEFLLLMPGTNVDGALVQARRICEHVAMTQIPTSAGNLQITISLGVAESLQNEVSGETLIERADAALYLAKLNGRNRVEADESKMRSQP